MIALATRKIRDAFWSLLSLITATGTTGMEFQSSTTLLLLGLFAINPWTNFNDVVPFQHELLSLMHEVLWGALFLAVGAAQSWANLKRRSQPRMICAFLAAAMYGYLAILACMVIPISLFFPMFVASAVSQAICFLVMSLSRFRILKITSGANLPKVRLDANA